MSDKTLHELRAEREPLYQRFVNNPNEFRLALKIKTIDDQIAECNRIIQQKKKTHGQLTR